MNIIISTKLRKFQNIDYGFGTKEFILKSKKAVFLNQVHGKKVVFVDGFQKKEIKADGLLTTKPNIILTVKTADCLPIIFYENRKKIVGIVHAGWKGTLKNIAGAMVKKIRDHGGNLNNLFVSMGPAIGNCCYKVDKKRAFLFQKINTNGKIVSEKNGFWHLDLKEATRHFLLASGVKEKNIEILNYCTHCCSDLFYSYRRDGKIGKNKQLISYIALKV